MSKNEIVTVLNSVKLSDDIGMGGYSDTAAYKLANGDIDATTAGLPDDVRAAIVEAKAQGIQIEFEDFGR